MPKILLHSEPGLRRVVDSNTVYFVEATGGDTRFHRLSRRRIRVEHDVRTLAMVTKELSRHGFVRIHNEYLVAPERVQLIRKRDDTDDWELRLAPPVNRVLPVARSRLASLWRAY
jgi:DNA-binding LytR/AlgR family response regulator